MRRGSWKRDERIVLINEVSLPRWAGLHLLPPVPKANGCPGRHASAPLCSHGTGPQSSCPPHGNLTRTGLPHLRPPSKKPPRVPLQAPLFSPAGFAHSPRLFPAHSPSFVKQVLCLACFPCQPQRRSLENSPPRAHNPILSSSPPHSDVPPLPQPIHEGAAGLSALSKMRTTPSTK